jgi:hypothetical protein
MGIKVLGRRVQSLARGYRGLCGKQHWQRMKTRFPLERGQPDKCPATGVFSADPHRACEVPYRRLHNFRFSLRVRRIDVPPLHLSSPLPNLVMEVTR